jgi:hypothetical protein
MAANKFVGEGKEFFSDWFFERRIEDLKRELEGALIRGQEDYAETVRGELRRLGALESAPKK